MLNVKCFTINGRYWLFLDL